MPKQWRQGLVNAFPIPEDRRPKKDSDHGKADCLMPGTFDFLKLPRELRDRVYQFALLGQHGHEQSPATTSLLRLNRQCHDEASKVLYTHTPMRLFVKPDFNAPLSIWEVPRQYRKWVTTFDMMVGTCWTGPPKSWRVTKSLMRMMSKFEAVRRLEIFVEVDPSIPVFAQHRISETFYTDFCGRLLQNTLGAAPQLETVQINGSTLVNKGGPLVSRLRQTAKNCGRTIVLDPLFLGSQKAQLEDIHRDDNV